MLLLIALVFTFAQAQPAHGSPHTLRDGSPEAALTAGKGQSYTRSFLRGLKGHEEHYKLNQYINGSVAYIENKVLQAAKEGKTYYTEPFYGCDMYGDPFLTKHCDVIMDEVKLKVQMLFPECDLAYDPRTGRYILSWV